MNQISTRLTYTTTIHNNQIFFFSHNPLLDSSERAILPNHISFQKQTLLLFPTINLTNPKERPYWCGKHKKKIYFSLVYLEVNYMFNVNWILFWILLVN